MIGTALFIVLLVLGIRAFVALRRESVVRREFGQSTLLDVLVLLYPYETFAEGSRRIERIRSLYKKQFDQQSVLRVDDQFVVWVSF